MSKAKKPPQQHSVTAYLSLDGQTYIDVQCGYTKTELLLRLNRQALQRLLVLLEKLGGTQTMQALAAALTATGANKPARQPPSATAKVKAAKQHQP